VDTKVADGERIGNLGQEALLRRSVRRVRRVRSVGQARLRALRPSHLAAAEPNAVEHESAARKLAQVCVDLDALRAYIDAAAAVMHIAQLEPADEAAGD